MIVELLEQIKKTPGSDKIRILRENIKTLEPIFEDSSKAYTYGVLKYPVYGEGAKTLDTNYAEFHDLLQKLHKREITGDAAVSAVSTLASQFTKDDQEYLECILTHNLKVGITYKTFKENLSPTDWAYEVALAKNIKDVKGVNPTDGTFFASRKLDGVRCTTHFTVVNKETSDIIFKSRTNHEFKTLENLKPFIREVGACIETDGRYVYDGECCIVDKDGNEDFKSIMKVISKKDFQIPNPSYRIFDFLTEEEFMMKEQSPVFSERYATMTALFDEAMSKSADKAALHRAIHPLEQERVTSQDIFLKWKQRVVDGNWEGFMLRKDCPYESGRKKSLLKVKEFEDAEFVVNSIEIGDKTYSMPGRGNVKFENCCTGLNITFKNNTVTVGSGITRDQSVEWAKNPQKIIGKTICVQYFEETVDDKTGLPSLRFPTLKFVYENGRNV